MARREHCLSSDMSYTQLWTLWASREKQVFKGTASGNQVPQQELGTQVTGVEILLSPALPAGAHNYWEGCAGGHRRLNPDTDCCSGTSLVCFLFAAFSWQIHDLDDKNKSRMITLWLCNLNNRPAQDRVNNLCKTILSLTWKVNLICIRLRFYLEANHHARLHQYCRISPNSFSDQEELARL